MKVLSYNIRGGWLQKRPERLRAVAAVIADSSADVVALQEVAGGESDNQAEALARLTDMEAVYHPVHNGRRGQLGNAILSRRPAARHRRHELPGRFPQRRGALEAHLQIGEGEVAVFSTHLVHLGGLMARLRRRQLDYLAAHLQQLDRPWILAGDFNTLSGSAELGPLRRAGLHLAPHPAPRATFPARSPRWRLDHIGVAPEWEWVTCEAVTSEASDHLPLLAELRWRSG